jgi:hypothetical protein
MIIKDLTTLIAGLFHKLFHRCGNLPEEAPGKAHYNMGQGPDRGRPTALLAVPVHERALQSAN